MSRDGGETEIGQQNLAEDGAGSEHSSGVKRRLGSGVGIYGNLSIGLALKKDELVGAGKNLNKWQSPRMLRKTNFMSLREKKVKCNMKERKAIDGNIDQIVLPDIDKIHTRLTEIFQSEQFMGEIDKNLQHFFDPKNPQNTKLVQSSHNELNSI